MMRHPRDGNSSTRSHGLRSGHVRVRRPRRVVISGVLLGILLLAGAAYGWQAVDHRLAPAEVAPSEVHPADRMRQLTA